MPAIIFYEIILVSGQINSIHEKFLEMYNHYQHVFLYVLFTFLDKIDYHKLSHKKTQVLMSSKSMDRQTLLSRLKPRGKSLDRLSSKEQIRLASREKSGIVKIYRYNICLFRFKVLFACLSRHVLYFK